MKSYSELIDPGQPLRLSIGGRLFYVKRSAGGPVLDITLRQGGNTHNVKGAGKGFRAQPVGGFDAIEIATTISGVVDFIVTDGDVDFKFDEDATIIGNDNSQALPVRTVPGQPLEVLFGGTVAPVFGVATIDNTDAEAIPTKVIQAGTVVNGAPVAVNAAGVVLLAANAARKGARLRNVGANPVAIGGAGLAFSNAAVVLQPGETWNENEAAPAEWTAVCEAGLTSIINVQTIN